MAYKVAFTKQAARTLRKIPKDIATDIRKKVDQIAEDPYGFHLNVTRLKNREGFRLRVGDWRVIYEIQKDKVLVLVLKIGSRGEIYR